jgi:regulator of replication initiation timing
MDTLQRSTKMVRFVDAHKEQLQQEVAEKYKLYKRIAQLVEENQRLQKKVDRLQRRATIKI